MFNDTSNSPAEVDRILESLSHQFRREIIEYFEQGTNGSQVTLSELADYLGEGHSQEEIDVLLHHRHLPKLADNDWIDFDPDENLIQYHGSEKAQSALKEVQQIFG